MIKKYFDETEGLEDGRFSVIADIDAAADVRPFSEKVDGEIPVLPMRNMVMFPDVVMPVAVGRKSSLKLVKESYKKGSFIAVVCQKAVEIEAPEFSDLHSIGVLAKVLRVLEMPDQTTTVILQSLERIRLVNITSQRPYLKGEVTQEKEEKAADAKEFEALVEACKDYAVRYIRTAELSQPESAFSIKNIRQAEMLINFIGTNLPFKKDEKIKLLECDAIDKRARALLELLAREVQLAELKADIQMKAREDMDQQQREYFLHQQIKAIQDELGTGSDQDIEELRVKADCKNWPEEINTLFLAEVTKLERINPGAMDYSTQLSYLQTFLALPWNDCSQDNYDLHNAEKVLNHDHYGLEKVKERILEHLAVLKLKHGEMKSPIICLYGPPGVGKTSLGRSIASSLGREYVRMSLGGVHDEAEIRGHRRTYVGAMPGRVIKGIQKAGTSNPVFILDEIDKIDRNNQGDPSSALLEVLDPEQNKSFHDNYLDVDYDLSRVMFIATANDLGNIPRPLLDRMELIEVSGYIVEEKIEIAKKFLVPKELEANGFQKRDIKFSKQALEKIIESYTRESGVRTLEKKIAKVLRKMAYEFARDENPVLSTVKPADLDKYLGYPEYSRDKYQGNSYAGVVTGLAWTAVGGEILFVETSLSKGKGGKLTLTGNLGDVMKESAVLALEYIKAHADQLGIDSAIFENWNIHVHVPEGAIPKDGPSAGVTMVTSLVSALKQRKVKKNLAMTGEITLRGKVLPVGGIKEKILAAKRAGITDIVLCEDNRKDIDDIQEMYLKGVSFHYVADIKDVILFALTDEKVDGAIDFSIKEGADK